MPASLLETVPIVDVDAHIVEPPDLFTSRIPARYRDNPDVPVVRVDPATDEDTWYIADKPGLSVGLVATAGWPQFFPDRPKKYDEIVDHATWDPHERLRRMDQHGIQTEILYGNIGGFGDWMAIRDPDLRLSCIQAYNNFALEWSSADPQRLVPMMGIPFWDVALSVREMERCAELGYHGMFFGSRPDKVGMPRLADHHWDPVWSTAQDLGWSVNFHIGFNNSAFITNDDPRNGLAANTVKMTVMTFLTNARAISDLITSGLCHRFPRLNWVSVESGAGYIPFLLDALDWQWLNCGVRQEHPEYDLMPSEYFRRQIYCTFWFERDPAGTLIDLVGRENIMYETDFPHPTSMTPGPGSVADVPKDFVAANFAELDEVSFRHVFHDNAARVYGLS